MGPHSVNSFCRQSLKGESCSWILFIICLVGKSILIRGIEEVQKGETRATTNLKCQRARESQRGGVDYIWSTSELVSSVTTATSARRICSTRASVPTCCCRCRRRSCAARGWLSSRKKCCIHAISTAWSELSSSTRTKKEISLFCWVLKPHGCWSRLSIWDTRTCVQFWTVRQIELDCVTYVNLLQKSLPSRGKHFEQPFKKSELTPLPKRPLYFGPIP